MAAMDDPPPPHSAPSATKHLKVKCPVAATTWSPELRPPLDQQGPEGAERGVLQRGPGPALFCEAPHYIHQDSGSWVLISSGNTTSRG